MNETLKAMGVTRVRARFKDGLWTARVEGSFGVGARGNACAEFDDAVRDAAGCLRLAEVSAGVRAPRTLAQVRADAEREWPTPWTEVPRG